MGTESGGDRFSVTAAREDGGELVVTLAGRITLEDADRLRGQLTALSDAGVPARVTVDLAPLEYLDSAAGLALVLWEGQLARRGVDMVRVSASAPIQGILALLGPEGLQRPSLRAEQGSARLLERIGSASVALYRDGMALLTFLGELLVALAGQLLRPREIRWGDFFDCLRKTGAEGLPIVALISLLIGLIIAFMSSLQLRQFGANLYVASLVAVAIVRELGPIMTAILVAGRSASAYAAEIGTMQVNEEVNALVTMGFDPIRFLAVPKLLATMIVVPLLTLHADLFGLIGGAIVGVMGLDLTLHTFFLTARRSITLFYLGASLVKAVVFAFVIVWVGCQRGFQVRGGVEAVGEATTSAVVTSILLIVVVDSAFAVVLHYIK